MKGFNLVPSTFLVRQRETRILSCPVDFMGTSFEPVFSTVVLNTISFQADVSSIAKMSPSWKLNCFWIQRTCITDTIIDTINHIQWILLSSCSFSSKRELMPSHKLFTPCTNSNKWFFDGRIVVYWKKSQKRRAFLRGRRLKEGGVYSKQYGISIK